MNEKLYDFLTLSLPKILPAVCLLSFIVVETIWVSLLICTACFAYLYIAQVFLEQSREWHNSTYLYVTIALVVFTFLEYRYMIVGRFLQ